MEDVTKAYSFKSRGLKRQITIPGRRYDLASSSLTKAIPSPRAAKAQADPTVWVSKRTSARTPARENADSISMRAMPPSPSRMSGTPASKVGVSTGVLLSGWLCVRMQTVSLVTTFSARKSGRSSGNLRKPPSTTRVAIIALEVSTLRESIVRRSLGKRATKAAAISGKIPSEKLGGATSLRCPTRYSEISRTRLWIRSTLPIDRSTSSNISKPSCVGTRRP